MFTRTNSVIAILGLLASLTALPAVAQDKMQDDKMSGSKMSAMQSHDSKMAVDKALMGLSRSDKRFVKSKMAKMSADDVKEMTDKFNGLSVPERKKAVAALRHDKMSGDKMGHDKMSGGKM